MNVVDAQNVLGEDSTDEVGPVGVVDELTVLDSVLDDYLEELEVEQDVEYTEYLDTAITRLEIAKAMMQVSKNSTDIAMKYQNHTVLELLVLLDQTYGPEDYPATNSDNNSTHTNIDMLTENNHVSGLYFVSHSTPEVDVLNYNNHHQKQYDCMDRITLTGKSLSVLTSYSDNTATITGTFDYPEDMDKNIRERRSNECLSFEHDETVKRHDVMISLDPREIIRAQVCTLTESNPLDSDLVSCNAFGANRLTVITTINTYDGVDSSKITSLGSTMVTLLFTAP